MGLMSLKEISMINTGRKLFAGPRKAYVVEIIPGTFDRIERLIDDLKSKREKKPETSN